MSFSYSASLTPNGAECLVSAVLASNEAVEPSPLLNLVTPKVCIWLVGLCYVYQSFSLANKLSHLVFWVRLGNPPLSKYSLNMFPKHLLGDPQVHTVHDTNAYHAQGETNASEQVADS